MSDLIFVIFLEWVRSGFIANKIMGFEFTRAMHGSKKCLHHLYTNRYNFHKKNYLDFVNPFMIYSISHAGLLIIIWLEVFVYNNSVYFANYQFNTYRG